MKIQKVIEKKTLEKLVQQKLIVKIDEFQYSYRSTNGYLEIIFAPGDLLLPPERQSLGSHKIEHTIASLVNQARDMLDCYNFYQILSDFVENQWMSDELNQKIKSIAQTSHASVPTLNKIAKKYYEFLHFGYPSWEHQSVAKEFGISVPTLKKYLKAMNLYDPSKQKHQGNKNLNQSKKS